MKNQSRTPTDLNKEHILYNRIDHTTQKELPLF